MQKIIPVTVERVQKNTRHDINKKIRNNTIRKIDIYKNSNDKILSKNIER